MRAEGSTVIELCRRIHQLLEIVAEAAKGLETVTVGFDDLGFRLEDLAPVFFDEDAHNFAHAPAGDAEQFKAGGSGAEERDTAVAKDADTVWESLEGLQFKPFYVKALELLRWVGHAYIL